MGVATGEGRPHRRIARTWAIFAEDLCFRQRQQHRLDRGFAPKTQMEVPFVA